MGTTSPEELLKLKDIDIKKVTEQSATVIDFLRSIQSGDDPELMIEQARNDPNDFGKVRYLLEQLGEAAEGADRVMKSNQAILRNRREDLQKKTAERLTYYLISKSPTSISGLIRMLKDFALMPPQVELQLRRRNQRQLQMNEVPGEKVQAREYLFGSTRYVVAITYFNEIVVYKRIENEALVGGGYWVLVDEHEARG